ncbi:DUF4826 family protein [Cerasicoccus frondis]|uniref:DUF4826 family protein n=1 Tax=Cerasicoccus frondis TaxID=490090 RepID=UPI0028526D70|nr:DUF4826 family protein [Cerasicoccus frondis]
MTDQEFSKWNSLNRNRCISYLEAQGIDDPQVAPWPAFDMAPNFAIWCVESKKVKGKIGWWVFAGDCPTDYVSENGKCHPREALRDLLKTWDSYIPEMKEGRQPAECKIGNGSNLPDLGDLLEKRVSILRDWLNDNDLWDNR